MLASRNTNRSETKSMLTKEQILERHLFQASNEEKLREEMKDLINDDVEEEDSDIEIGSKRKKRLDFNDVLEDEDYDLLEENLGVKVQRKKKFKRLRRIEDEESDDMDAEDDNSRLPTYDTQDVLEESEGESDESDFIVDDDGQPISKGKEEIHQIY
ncbi:transcription elongation factor spt6 [Caerostris extrusa]|uniref:Transcription elongation factor spt6 n=1 Tax=Caerostris extrusa TaxID=172846 RepID=A0AAV4WL76_CAEEX|nr:transcription elongation factor spt6 [Caerostris extrusa]